MDRYIQQARMSFEQFETMCRERGLRPWRGKEHIGDSVIAFAYAVGDHSEYKCDNVHMWSRTRHIPPGYQRNGDGTFSMDW
jgi:hypothetical protein